MKSKRRQRRCFLLISVVLVSLAFVGCNPPLAPLPPISQDCQQASDCGNIGYTCQAGTCTLTNQETTTEPPNKEIPKEPIKQPDEQTTQTEFPGPDTEKPTDTNDAGTTEQAPDAAPCQPGSFETCYTGKAGTEGIGPCATGTRVCQTNGTWTNCLSETTPQNEVCDGVDNDCNGQIDDKVVELGDPCQDNNQKGECQNGTYTACTNKQLTCTSNTQPTTEICDDGKDNDCDGTIDSGTKCPCKDGETRPCGNDTGSCTKGTETCQSGQWGTCVGGTQPTAEICDGIDNDCDGQTDEDFTTLGNSCTAGQGICQATGRIVCSTDKQSTICNATAGTNSTAEICDGKDNDCNGQVDDVATVGDTCTAGQGECQNTGKKVCNFNTNKVECNAKAGTPKTEVCDGKDNDCDGIIDNAPGTRNTGSLKQTCYTGPQNTKGIGPCRAGTQSCINGKWGACFGEVTPSAVDGCSNEDANCNGTPNEGCSCTNGTTRPCGTNTGTCVAGNQTCNNGQWGPCTGNTAPTTEVCDGKDNNCNGQTDEGTSGGTCTNGTGACQRNGTLICKGAKLECNAVPGNPSPEICDGKDNNCDGQVDNLSSTASQFCNTGLLGLCAKGTPSCVNGQITCTPAFQPGQLTEICRNNQDDDCDGKVDEICGPLYPYALVNRGGGFFNQKKRAFSSAARTGTGT
jgi:hypothetical protein